MGVWSCSGRQLPYLLSIGPVAWFGTNCRPEEGSGGFAGALRFRSATSCASPAQFSAIRPSFAQW